MLKIALLWMSRRVPDKRRERTRLTLQREEAEEAGAYGSRVTHKERCRRDGWKSFKGEGSVGRRREPSPGPVASRGTEGQQGNE